jgi:hypothetical protein
MRGIRLAPLVRAVFLGAALSCWAAEHLVTTAQAGSKSIKEEIPADGEDIPVEGDGAGIPVEPGAEEQAQARPVPPSSGPPAPITFTAYLSEGSAPMTSGIVWRIFAGRAENDGNYKLLKTLRDARPTIELKPGEYLVNIAYGRANLTRKIGVWPEKPANEDFVVNAGGLRLTATLARTPITQEHLLKFEIFSDTQDQSGNRQKILADLRPGVVMRLNSGVYHIVSTYGDANSSIATDVVIEPGKITEAGIDHDAGKVTFKLVQRSGGEAVADTRWTIYNAGGDVIKESAGAFPTHILAAGDYRVAAQHGERQFAGAFTVASGDSKLVEVLMQ